MFKIKTPFIFQLQWPYENITNTSWYLWPTFVLSTTFNISIAVQDMHSSLHMKNSLIFRSFVMIRKLKNFPCHATETLSVLLIAPLLS